MMGVKLRLHFTIFAFTAACVAACVHIFNIYLNNDVILAMSILLPYEND